MAVSSLTPDKLVSRVMLEHGIPRHIWWPIMMGESRGDPSAWNQRGEDSRGLFQINVQANPVFEPLDLFDPVINAVTAVRNFIKPAYEYIAGITDDPHEQAAYVWRHGIKPEWTPELNAYIRARVDDVLQGRDITPDYGWTMAGRPAWDIADRPNVPAAPVSHVSPGAGGGGGGRAGGPQESTAPAGGIVGWVQESLRRQTQSELEFMEMAQRMGAPGADAAADRWNVALDSLGGRRLSGKQKWLRVGLYAGLGLLVLFSLVQLSKENLGAALASAIGGAAHGTAQ